MRAITVDEYGAAPALTEVPDPRPEAGQVLIKIEAAGVNPMDRALAGGWSRDAMRRASACRPSMCRTA